jgi:hypothetical protein
MLMLTVARTLPKSVAEQCRIHAIHGLQTVEKELSASPSSDVHLEELRRVMVEGVEIIECASQSNQ